MTAAGFGRTDDRFRTGRCLRTGTTDSRGHYRRNAHTHTREQLVWLIRARSFAICPTSLKQPRVTETRPPLKSEAARPLHAFIAYYYLRFAARGRYFSPRARDKKLSCLPSCRRNPDFFDRIRVRNEKLIATRPTRFSTTRHTRHSKMYWT